MKKPKPMVVYDRYDINDYLVYHHGPFEEGIARQVLMACACEANNGCLITISDEDCEMDSEEQQRWHDLAIKEFGSPGLLGDTCVSIYFWW